MVVFVLDGARQQAIRLEFDNLIFQASGFHPDRKGTDDTPRIPGMLRQPSTPARFLPNVSTSG